MVDSTLLTSSMASAFADTACLSLGDSVAFGGTHNPLDNTIRQVVTSKRKILRHIITADLRCSRSLRWCLLVLRPSHRPQRQPPN